MSDLQRTEGIHPDTVFMLDLHITSCLDILDHEMVAEEVTKAGDNYMGTIKGLTVTGKQNDENITLKWILKIAPHEEGFRVAASVASAYHREIYVYKILFPLFDQFQKEKFVVELFNAHPPHVKSYTIECREAIVMIDMREYGFFMKNRQELLELEYVKLAMKTYGTFHAVSLAIKDQQSRLFAQIKANTREYYFTTMSEEKMERHQELNKTVLQGLIKSKGCSKEIEFFTKYAKHAGQIIHDAFVKSYNDPYSVICHGDCWINNFLFKCGDSANPTVPTEICLLDFQNVCYGSPAFDLSYFLFACTDKAFRDQYYDGMIKLYYDSLCSHLNQLGSDPERLLPFNILEEHLKRYSVMGLNIIKLALYLMVSESHEIPDFKSVYPTIRGQECYKTQNLSIYENRMIDVVKDFVAKGYLDFINTEYDV